MKNILRSGAVLALFLGLSGAGCGGKADEAIGELKKIKDEMCACKDKACAEKVTDKMMKMSKDNKDTKVTADQMKAASAITEELTKCMSKAMGMGADAPPASP